MRSFKLTENETRFARAIEEAEWAIFDVQSVGGPKPAIRAEFVRRVFLGLPVISYDGSTPGVVAVRACGIRVAGVCIEGELLLEDMEGPDDGPLPPLVLRNCDISKSISLRRTHIRQLSLEGCRITHLSAHEARVTGSVFLSNVKSAEDAAEYTGADNDGLCWLEFRGVTTGGSFDVRASHLVAPPAQADFDRAVRFANYALDLTNARIAGSVRLWPSFTAVGGVSIGGANIGNDVVARGSRLRGLEGLAFNSQNAAIRGDVILRSASSVGQRPIQFEADGDISFLGAKIGGTLAMTGARLTGSLAGNGLDVRGNMFLTTSSDTDIPESFKASRGVWFSSARIAGDLDMSGADVEGLSLSNAEVGGNAYLSTWFGKGAVSRFTSHDAVWLSGATIHGNLHMNGAKVKVLDATNANIDGGAYLCAVEFGGASPVRFDVTGDVGLWGIKIAGNLDMRGAHVGESIVATDARIGCNAYVSGWLGERENIRLLAGWFWSERAKIIGDLHLSAATLGGVTATNAEIGGDAYLGAASESNTSGISLIARGNVSFRGATIANRLNVSVVKFQPDSHARRSDLDLRDASVGALCDADGTGWVHGQKPILRLEGFDYRRLYRLDGAGLGKYASEGRLDPLFQRVLRLYRSRGTAIQKPLRELPGWLWPGIFLAIVALVAFAAFVRMQVIPAWYKFAPAIALLIWIFARHEFDEPAWRRRLKWLSLQYAFSSGRKPRRDEYSPDPYERLTRVYRAEGAFEDARQITVNRLRIERRLSLFLLFRPIGWVYAVCFNSGLSPRRAILTFSICIVFGWCSVIVADRGLDPRYPEASIVGRFLTALSLPVPRVDPVLVVETSAVTSYAIPGDEHPGFGIGSANIAKVINLNCGDQIEPFLYALDAFVPALELHQESKCGIKSDPGAALWWIGRAAYSILGWIVTSLTILTVSGVLRRHLET